MSVAAGKSVRPLYFVASYPRSGGTWVRSMAYLLIVLSRPDAPKQIDMRNLDNIIPWDAHGLLYRAVTGREHDTLDELEVAEARPKVHTLLATKDISLPVVWTHAIRGTFHGHETINPKVTGGATYVVRNPLDVAAALVEMEGVAPLRIIELMMKTDRRVQQTQFTVAEPQGSWTQNSKSSQDTWPSPRTSGQSKRPVVSWPKCTRPRGGPRTDAITARSSSPRMPAPSSKAMRSK